MAKQLEIQIEEKVTPFIVSKKLYGIYGWFKLANHKYKFWFLIFKLFRTTCNLHFTFGEWK